MALQGTKLFLGVNTLQNFAEDHIAKGSVAATNDEFEQIRLLSLRITKEINPNRRVNDCWHDAVRFARS